ncbi:MAG: inositol monophosphatase family protein [Candidatus Andersenbacteria bacterium]|nr:inositol monophosphatase family protein [bacterium]MDZ4225554.1 inositol monophosphatase family protein [Candidatus Andersenbacteria bacterium]
MSYERELEIIRDAVKRGGQLALQMRPGVSAADITTKGGDPRDILTEVDPAVQRLIFDALGPKFPGVTLIGEEGKTRRELEKLARAGDKIVVDPIDGTTNFTRHKSFKWGTTACLIKDNQPVAGAVFLPVIDVMITASRGGGCFVNGQRQAASGTVPLNQSVIGVEWYYLDETRAQKQLALITAARGSHANLSAVYSVYELVQGEIDAYLNIHIPERSACVWDFAAGHLFMREMVSPEIQDSVAFFPDGRPLSYENHIGMEVLLTPYPGLAEEIIAKTS